LSGAGRGNKNFNTQLNLHRIRKKLDLRKEP